jgi:hypothetical protein
VVRRPQQFDGGPLDGERDNQRQHSEDMREECKRSHRHAWETRERPDL